MQSYQLQAMRPVVIAYLALLTLPARASPIGQGNHAVAHTLAAYPEALCLDGSSGRYYFRPGEGDGRSKYVIYFQGGGFCTSHADCAARSQTYLGTTRKDSDAMHLDYPVSSSSSEDNPLLWNWNQVYVRYCDGGYLSGHQDEAQKVGEKKVFYRGYDITVALMMDMEKKHGLGGATDVVFAGCSSGAIRTFAHIDALRKMVPSQAKVSGFPDSGFYLDLPMFTPLKRFVIDGQNGSGLLNEQCKRAHVGAEEKCLIGNIVANYIRTPLFAWQSRFDTDQRGCEMTRSCAESKSCVQAYGDNLTSEMGKCVRANPSLGVFLDSCSRHCAAASLPRDDGTGMTPLQAFAEWYIGGARSFGERADFPCESCCGASKLSSSLLEVRRAWVGAWPVLAFSLCSLFLGVVSCRRAKQTRQAPRELRLAEGLMQTNPAPPCKTSNGKLL
eukprot:TRINITY_DN17835_c0_g5_i1.p1 TRINITY_DN17835_c0_g5~~TRINITY_DN17835_c0_g5_i1.p1  ORF type:complete len:443 (+),score=51.57 TRINITY_DN17835_c0_g5_i1:39-1367(+)